MFSFHNLSAQEAFMQIKHRVVISLEKCPQRILNIYQLLHITIILFQQI